MNALRMTLLTLLASLTACGISPTIDPIPCPPRPILEGVELTPDQADIVVENYIRMMTYAKKLEVRANCENPD